MNPKIKKIGLYLGAALVVAVAALLGRDCKGHKEATQATHDNSNILYDYKVKQLRDSIKIAQKETDTLLYVAATLKRENLSLKTAITRKPKTFTPQQAVEQLTEDDSLVRDQAYDSLQVAATRAYKLADSLGTVAEWLGLSIEQERRLQDKRDSLCTSELERKEEEYLSLKEEHKKEIRRVRWKNLGLGTLIGFGLGALIP